MLLTDDTWVYDLGANTWTQKSPLLHPSARVCMDMAYVCEDQVLLFSGSDWWMVDSDETWVYDLSANTWSQDFNAVQPLGRYGHRLSETSMDGSSYLVLFGGVVDTIRVDETWTFGGGGIHWPARRRPSMT